MGESVGTSVRMIQEKWRNVYCYASSHNLTEKVFYCHAQQSLPLTSDRQTPMVLFYSDVVSNSQPHTLEPAARLGLPRKQEIWVDV